LRQPKPIILVRRPNRGEEAREIGKSMPFSILYASLSTPQNQCDTSKIQYFIKDFGASVGYILVSEHRYSTVPLCDPLGKDSRRISAYNGKGKRDYLQ
jgi:hypothetical protein